MILLVGMFSATNGNAIFEVFFGNITRNLDVSRPLVIVQSYDEEKPA